MAETALTKQTGAKTGVSPSYQSIDSNGLQNGVTIPNASGKVRVRIKGATGKAGMVTFKAQTACSLGTLHDQVTTASALDAATKELECGPFPTNIYNSPDGLLHLTFSGTLGADCTGFTIAAIEDAS